MFRRSVQPLWNLLFVALALAAAWLPTDAAARKANVFWRVVYDPGLGEGERQQAEAHLMSVLARAEASHIFTEKALVAWLARQPMQIPPCFEGREVCPSGPELLLDSLGVDGVVVADIARHHNEWQVRLTYYRRYGSEAQVAVKAGQAVDVIFREAVGELFTLEAVLGVYTDPPGATLFVNGKLAGETPFRFQAAEGKHTLRIESEGYEVSYTELHLAQGESRDIELILTPKDTQITVLTSAPNAQVFINGEWAGEAGQAIDVLPGQHTLELQAPGYRPISMRFAMAPAKRRTIHLAMLRLVEDPWQIRERGIGRYRLSAFAGMDLLWQRHAFTGTEASAGGRTYSPTAFAGADDMLLRFTTFSLGMAYHDTYWGLQLLRLSFGWAGYDGEVSLQTRQGGTSFARGDGASFVGVYPLQASGHYLWGPFMAEANTGFGLALTRLSAREEGRDLDFSSSAFSWNLSLGGRYYWSEEWYAYLGYQFQKDFSEGHGWRHGVNAGVGFNLPVLLREPPAMGGGPLAPDALDDFSPVGGASAAPEVSTDVPAAAESLDLADDTGPGGPGAASDHEGVESETEADEGQGDD